MLLAEYDYETDIAVQRAEEREIAFAQGIERGIERGIKQGISQGIEQGSYQKARETARNLTEMGFAVEAIAKATGLTVREVEALS